MPQMSHDNERTLWRSAQAMEAGVATSDASREFSEGASESAGFSRRGFMQIMAASMALAGAASCRRPEEKILPYTQAPEGLIPGKANFYASAIPRSRGSIGVLVKSHEGRPSKIDGHPGHSASKGASDSFAQADLLDLYDPDRLQQVRFKGFEAASDKDGMTAKYRLELRQSFLRFDKELEAFTAEAKKNGGASLAILSAPVTSPTEERLRTAVRESLPKTSFAYWEALNDDNSAEALRLFRGAANPDARLRVDLTKVDTIVSLDADFMSASYRDSLELVRGWATRRKVSGKKEDAEKIDLNRLWSVEANFSLTGSNADHRLRVKPSQVGDVLVLVAQKLASGPLKGLSLPAFDSKLKLDAQSAKDVTYAAAIDALATELTSNAAKGRRSVILCGESQPVNVQVLALLINSALGAFANGSLSVVPAAAKADKLLSSSIAELAEGIKSGRITQLVIVGGNPAYDAPAELGFADLVAKAKTIHLTHDFNETSEKAAIAVPAAHWLESWGDTRASDGSVALIQPLIAPLFDGISANELLARLAGLGKVKGHDLLKATHGLQGRDFDAVLAKGLISGPAAPLAVVPDLAGCGQVLATLKAGEPAEYEVVFVPCAKMLDGRYANNAWLQELPEPITKIAWDNAALVSMATARKLGAAHRRSNGIDETDVLMVKVGGVVAELPVWPVPGIADGVVVLALGYGRKVVGHVGRGEKGSEVANYPINNGITADTVGVNVYPLRCSGSLFSAKADSVAKTGKILEGRNGPASTQEHWAMEDRELVKTASVAAFKHEPLFAREKENPVTASLFPGRLEWDIPGSHQWAMVIDLNACTGCGTCSIACQAENNITVVGKAEVHNGREMHWIRLDRYFYADERWLKNQPESLGDADLSAKYDVAVEAYHQPIGCQHCQMAPCEQVCPVAATQHSPEGLNDMAYNRCIGTRYCANNCPFKVRRFNFFAPQEEFKAPRFEVKKMVYNPNVTVRSRGVIEKCTYCTQRISEAKIDAKVSGNGQLETDSFSTACAEACPTQAITFGDKNDAKSAVAKQRADVRNYTLLPGLNVQPRTSFLARLNNPAAALVKEKAHEHKGHH